MIPKVELTFKNGEKLMVEGYQSQVSDRIRAARADGLGMLDFELPLTPTGQKVTIDPNEVTIIIKDPYQ
jgi:hypothetical protein